MIHIKTNLKSHMSMGRKCVLYDEYKRNDEEKRENC